jgi:hypothetical protein
MAPVAAWGIYELGSLAAAAISALFLVSPQGQKASKETADALDRLLQKKKEPDEDPKGPIPPVCVQKCPEEPKKCPVCGRVPDPAPGFMPPYLDPPRVPLDKETILMRGAYTPTKWVAQKGGKIWQDVAGNYYHRDTYHEGYAAEVEMYDKRENHMGAICPHCGTPIPGSKVEGRVLRKKGGE